MSFVVKISADYQNHTAQFIDPENLKWQKESSNIGQASFSLKITDSQISEIEEYKKIDIFEVVGVEDVLVWSGYIEDIIIKIQTLDIICKDEKNFMRNRILYSDKSYSAQTPEYIIDDILTEANTRASDSFFSSDVGFTSTITKSWSKGTDYFSILDDIANQLGGEWNVLHGVVSLRELIGTDRTSGGNFLELRYNSEVPNGNNITDFEITKKGSKIGNAIIGKAGASYSSQEDVVVFSRVERFKDFPEGDVSAQTLSFLDKSKVSQKEFKLTIITNDLDHKEVEAGDKVKLTIESGYDMQDFSGEVRVISKNSEVQNGVVTFDIQVSSEPRKLNVPSNILQEMQRDIATIQKRI